MMLTRDISTIVIVSADPVRMIAWPLANDSLKVKAANAIVNAIVTRAAVAQIVAFIVCSFYVVG
jgi:hypothetical protein